MERMKMQDYNENYSEYEDKEREEQLEEAIEKTIIGSALLETLGYSWSDLY